MQALHSGSFHGRLIARDYFSLRKVANLLEHGPVGKRIQSCKSRQVHAFVEEELSDLPFRHLVNFYSLKNRRSIMSFHNLYLSFSRLFKLARPL